MSTVDELVEWLGEDETPTHMTREGAKDTFYCDKIDDLARRLDNFEIEQRKQRLDYEQIIALMKDDCRMMAEAIAALIAAQESIDT